MKDLLVYNEKEVEFRREIVNKGLVHEKTTFEIGIPKELAEKLDETGICFLCDCKFLSLNAIDKIFGSKWKKILGNE